MNDSALMKVFQPINYSLRLHEIFSSLRIDNSKRKSRTMLNRSTLPLLTRNSINVPLGIHSEINAGRSSHSANPRHCSTLSCFRFAQIPNVFAMEYNCKKRKSGCYAYMSGFRGIRAVIWLLCDDVPSWRPRNDDGTILRMSTHFMHLLQVYIALCFSTAS